MLRTPALLILICLSLIVSGARYNSKRTRFPQARNEDLPLRRLMIINNEGYKISDQHRNRVWDLYRKKSGLLHPENNLIEEENQSNLAKSMNLQDKQIADVYHGEGGVSDLTITQADGTTGLQISMERDPSSRIGLAQQVSAHSLVWTPIMTPRIAPTANNPSINEIDSVDYFPYQNRNRSVITKKPDIVLGNNSGIVPGPSYRVGGSEVEWLTSTTTTTTQSPETRVAFTEHPTSFSEFINAQLSLLLPMWTNFFKFTDHFSREIADTMSSVLDYLLEAFVVILSGRKRRAIGYNISEL